MLKASKYLLLFSCLLLFNACLDQGIDPSDTFVVTLEQDNSVGYTSRDFEKGEKIRLVGIGNVPEGLLNFSFEKSILGGNFTAVSLGDLTLISGNIPTLNSGITSFSFIVDLLIRETSGQSVRVRIVVGSQSSTQIASQSYQVVAQGQGASGGIFPYLRPSFDITLGGQGTNTAHYLATTIGNISGAYNPSEVSSLSTDQKRLINVTTGVTNTEGNAASGAEATISALISPSIRVARGFDDAGLGSNATTSTFKLEPNISTQADFDAITSTDVANLSHAINASNFQALITGNIYSFISQNGKKGYLRVLFITGTEENQLITFKVLSQR